jgi:hypothetical protein
VALAATEVVPVAKPEETNPTAQTSGQTNDRNDFLSGRFSQTGSGWFVGEKPAAGFIMTRAATASWSTNNIIAWATPPCILKDVSIEVDATKVSGR